MHQQSTFEAELSDDLETLFEQLCELVSEDILDMLQPRRRLFGNVHYFVTRAFSDTFDKMDLMAKLQEFADASGSHVKITFEFYNRDRQIWKMRVDREPTTI